MGQVRLRLDRSNKKSRLLFLPTVALAVLTSACSPGGEPSGASGKAGDDSASIKTEVKELRAYAGETADVTLRIKNRGRSEWSSRGQNPCFVSFHLLGADRSIVRFDNPRTPLPGVVRPGTATDVNVRVKAPLAAGDYRVEFDVLREGLYWFKDKGGVTAEVSLVDRERVWPEDEIKPGLDYGRYTYFQTAKPELDALRKLIRLTLHHDEVEFTGKTGTVDGFAAGAGYPQIWLRDAATIIPASQYYYPEGFLSSWIEEHLAYQGADGALEDWLDPRGRTDKNTVETDQETSAVQASFLVFGLKGDRGRDWLLKPVAGGAVVDRLERALRFPFARRYSARYGLLTGAHTADWGDVDPEDAGQQAIYVDERTHWTADIYDQAMAYEACLEMAAMLRSLGRQEPAAAWLKAARDLQARTNRYLWQESRGFYRVHIHLDDWRHDFDEGDMFAMGGNAQAVISGLADGRQSEKIIDGALARQARFGVSTISGALLPPYPAGFFKHPQMDEPYEYQNGGQWDWFGGRLILAMFENGFSRVALDKLVEVARKDLANEGFYEWDTREGLGRGSDYYGGSAGSLARALYEGYFGIRLSANGLVLAPRLAEDSALVHVFYPAADIFAAYDYQPDPADRKISLRYNSNDPRPGTIKIWVPWGTLGMTGASEDRTQLEVLRDGVKVPFKWSRARQDDFIEFKTDFLSHTLEIRPSAGK
jgi:hypothetical protein